MDTLDDNKDDAPDTTTHNWASRAGYKPGDVLQRRTPRRRNVFAEINKMQVPEPLPRKRTVFAEIGKLVPAPVVQGPAPIVPGDPFQVDATDTQGVVLRRALKGGSDKKTCFVDFGGKTLVVKGGSGNEADHIAASEYIGKLGLKGVRVPAVRQLSDAEKAALTAHFAGGDVHAQDLATSLTMKNPDGTTAGQISELAKGMAADSIFMDADIKEAVEEAHKLRQALKDEDTNKAWAAAVDALMATFTTAAKRANVLKQASATTDAERAQALKWVKTNCVQVRQEQLIELLSDIEGKRMAAGLKKMDDDKVARDDGQVALAAFAKSAAGVEAFAGLAVADLITGMDDRILTKFNGGNFLYDKDSQELVCVDNSKSVFRNLNVAAHEDGWAGQITSCVGEALTLEEGIYLRLYGKSDSKGSGAATTACAPGNYVTFSDAEATAAKTKIRQTLLDVIARTEADPSQNPAAIKRAGLVKARLAVDYLFKDTALPQNPPQAPAKLDATDKIARAGKSFFTANKKDKRKDTQKIKDDLRAGKINAAQARVLLQDVENKAPSVANDHRSQKIKYLADVYEACETLQGLADDWTKRLAATPPDLLSDTNFERMGKALNESFVKRWRTGLAGDKKALAMFDAAWGKFPAQLTAASNAPPPTPAS